MPLNENGGGPETDPLKAVSFLYQVWDCACCTVFESESEEAAREYIRTCETGQEDGGLDARTKPDASSLSPSTNAGD